MKKTFGVVKKRQDKEEIVDFKKFDIEELLLNLVSHILRTSFDYTVLASQFIISDLKGTHRILQGPYMLTYRATYGTNLNLERHILRIPFPIL